MLTKATNEHHNKRVFKYAQWENKFCIPWKPVVSNINAASMSGPKAETDAWNLSGPFMLVYLFLCQTIGFSKVNCWIEGCLLGSTSTAHLEPHSASIRWPRFTLLCMNPQQMLCSKRVWCCPSITSQLSLDSAVHQTQVNNLTDLQPKNGRISLNSRRAAVKHCTGAVHTTYSHGVTSIRCRYCD